jgi:WD40 repeat protein
MTDVFISYAREDRPFVQRLHDALANEGRESWVDWEGIPASAKWMAEVRAAIDEADCFCFVVSPDSVESPVCREEAAHAAASNKRILPLLHREVPDGLVPETVAAHNWIEFDGQASFDDAFATLVRALETEPEHLRAHTRLLVRSKEWEASGDRSQLLRGQDLNQAETWLASAAGKEPTPTQGQTAYVLASRKAASRRQRTTVGAVAIALVVSLVLSTVAVIQRGAAEDQRRAAERQTSIARSRELALSAVGLLEADPELSVLLAVEAVNTARTDQAVDALRRALAASHVRTVLRGHTSMISTAGFSPDETRLLTGSYDGSARIWDSTSGETVVELLGHTDAVLTAMFSPDGSRLVTASYDGTARLWDAVTGDARAELNGHGGTVYTARFDPNGTAVVTAGQDGTARVWDAATGSELEVLSGHTRPVYDAAFSPDGRSVVTASDDGTARIWQVRTGASVAVLVGHEEGVYAAAFSPDGSRILTASEDGTARIWDAADGAQIAVLRAGEVALNGASFSADGELVVTASEDGTARIWDAETGSLRATLRGHRGEVNAAIFSSDGSLVLTSGSDSSARVWDVASGQLLTILRGHEGEVLSGSFSESGLVVTAGEDGVARVWDPLSSGSILSEEEGFVAQVAFTPDGDRIVTASDAGVRIWTREGELLTTSGAEDAPYFSEAVSPDGRLVAAGGRSGTAYVWRIDDGELVAELRGHEAEIPHGDVAFSPDSRRVLTGSFDGTARLWDATTGQALQVLRGHVGVIYGVAFSPDGDRVVTAGQDGTARVWDSTTGEELSILRGFGQMNHALFDPAGELVATVGAEDVARVWDADTGDVVTTFTGLDSGASGAMFSPDGRRLMTWSPDGTASVWDVRTGSELVVLSGHEGIVWDASFDETGTRVATVGADATIRVWDAHTGQAVAIFTDHRDEGTSIALDPMGEFVASGDVVGTIWVNHCDVCGSVTSLLDLADARASRRLDAAERVEYLHAPLTHASPSPVAGSPPVAGATLSDGLPAPGHYVVPLMGSAVSLDLDEGWQALSVERGEPGSTRVARGILLFRRDNPAQGVTILGIRRLVDGHKDWDEDRNLISVGRDPITYFLDHPALRTFHVAETSIAGYPAERVDTEFRSSHSIQTNPWPPCGPTCAPIVPIWIEQDGRSISDHDLIVVSGLDSYDRWIVARTATEVLLIDIYAPVDEFDSFVRDVQPLLNSIELEPPVS